MTAAKNQHEILFEKKGHAGLVTINRPKALNAVTHPMIKALHKQLRQWESDDSVHHVIIKAVGDKAFSAGGDIRYIYDHGLKKNYSFDFFADEYRFNAYLAHYPKPYIALVDGIIMGGGVGIAVHGSHLVAGEGISFAMPEVGIGFFPDVGGSHFLPQMPGRIGLYLGLTGTRLKQGDCLYSGFATHSCASASLADLEEALIKTTDIDETLMVFDHAVLPETLQGRANAIDKAFSMEDPATILDALEEMSGDDNEIGKWAQKVHATMKTKSPTSLEIAYRQITRGAWLSIDECMRMEYRILYNVLQAHDFYEGIRAAIIDKDGKPAWEPPTLDKVHLAYIEKHFEPIGDAELALL